MSGRGKGGRRWPGLRFGLRLVAGAGALVVAALAVEALVVARLEASGPRAGIRWYARPPVLALGQRLDASALERHLRRLGYEESSDRYVGAGQFVRGSRSWLIGTRERRHLGPLATGRWIRVRLDRSGRIARLEDADGERLRVVPLEPELLRQAGDDVRLRTPLEDVPPHLVDAILVAEDQRFFRHHGLDFRRIVAAAIANLRDGRVVQGGSTITQQLAKNLFLDSRRSVVRKLREAAMAIVLELRHTKAEILEAYLNEIYFGRAGGVAIRGVGGAAEQLLGKDVVEVDLADAALLAGLVRGPNLYSPLRHPERARERRDLVLRLMLERGVIDTERHEEASSGSPRVRSRPSPGPPARYFLDYLAELRATSAPDPRDELRSRSVVTSLDAGLQRAAAQAVRDGLERLESEHARLGVHEGSGAGALQAALVAVDPRTGDVLAMVGGRDYGESQFNRAVHARRQPGSSFKPIVALAAVARRPPDRADGSEPPFTLASVLEDEPLEVETPAGPWRPVNYDGRYRGAVTLREALERSLNVPFARLGLELGPERIVEMAQRLGVESPVRPYPSLALGSFEVTPLEMARAYGALGAGGTLAESRPLLGFLDADGSVLAARDPTTRRVSSPAEAFLVTSALRGAVERGTGRSLRGLGFDGVVAAKSGTTNEFRDGWFIGYTPTLAVAVWVGFDDGRSLGLPGARVALPIFSRFMVAATGPDGERGPWGSRGFERPGGLEIVEIDRRTGLRAGPGCPGQRELFLSGTAPRRSCSPYGAYVYGSGESSWPGRPPRSAARLEPELRRLLGALAGGDETDVRAALERVLREPDLRARARALLQSLTDEARLER